LQVDPAMNWFEPVLQLAEAHEVPLATCWQPLEPLQRPVFPQVAPVAHWPVGAALPARIGAQVPLPFTLQALQVPVQAETLQQTPSVQNPPDAVEHWLEPVQAAPAASFGVQTPLAQKALSMQSVSRVQLVLQAVAPHRYWPQPMVIAVEQLPAPEQNVASVATPAAEVPLQEGFPHWTVIGCCVQAPPPLQVPVLPQVPFAPQRR
jgi:hypothetical protein